MMITLSKVSRKWKVVSKISFSSRSCSNDQSSSKEDDKNATVPPEPTNCCMSGCANCVWIQYAETLLKIFGDSGDKARKIILEKIEDPNMKAFLSMELRNLESRKPKPKE